MSLSDKLQRYVKDLNQKGLLRKRVLHDASLLLFDSNDYLSLSQEKRIRAAYQRGYLLYPTGSGGSLFLNGYHSSHQALERAFSEWLKCDAAVLFSSGFAANLAVMALLGTLKVPCLIDKGVHASIYDGLKLNDIPFRRFLHNDFQDASSAILKSVEQTILLTEGIFSMSGQLTPLAELSPLCQQKQMALIVDEAHSLGILGQEGQGAVSHHGLSQKDVPLRIMPLGKAFAGQGALVTGDALWIEALLQAGRSLVYSTAISPALCFGLLKTLEVVAEATERRAKLQDLIHYFRSALHQSPLKWTNSASHIQQVQLGCPHLALHYAALLKQQGISCSAIRPPTVSMKASGLRIILNAHHQPEQIDRLFKHLALIYEHTSSS